MEDLDLHVGASIWGFYSGQPRSTWPSLADAVRSILSVDASLGVEVWATKAMDAPEADRDELDALIDACRAAAFVTVHVRGMFWFWDPAKLRDEIDFAQSVGAGTLVVHPVCFGLKRPGDRIDAVEVRRIAEYGAARGVRIALENVRDSIWVLDHVLEEIGDDPDEANLGVCLDLGHAHLSRDAGREPVTAYLDRYADALIHLHVHDNAGARDEHLVPGDGTIDWAQTLSRIASQGYSGTAVLETHGGDSAPPMAIDRSLRALRAFSSDA